ncbi:bactofilin family protein [Arenibacter certesii]|uniref:Polymer-forming cytoskeletal protein n=1 Tax=Arenibacter certesii TaxID=228955 RepID=A0A918MMY0_9FLAO|nr:polymer-forming cytoskeletal protein [Arenibacter certesii]GGW38425.1 hypothetical protein GCM10007383_23930 [Arenibacter certesii]
MFSDNKKVRTTNEPTGQPNRIGKSTKIKGDIVSDADFRIDGELEGNVTTSGKVVIGAGGNIKGKVECAQADIEGSFNGELIVTDLLSLKSSAIIDGTVSVAKLAVEPGATFNASCTMRGKGTKGSASNTQNTATVNGSSKTA